MVEILLGWAASNYKSIIDQVRNGELNNSDDFWTPSINRWMKDASLELTVPIEILRSIQYAAQSDYDEFWKKHGLPIVEF